MKLEPTTVSTVYNFLRFQNPTVSFIGYALGGSQQIGFMSKNSDFDLAFFTFEKLPTLSNNITFYDHNTTKLIEIPLFSLMSLADLTLSQLIGYRSETFFWMIRQKTILLNMSYSTLWEKFIQLLKNYEHFWIHCCLKGYLAVVKKTLNSVEAKKFDEASRANLKKIYRLCYIYLQVSENTDLEKATLFKLKSSQVINLTASEILNIKKAINYLKENYLLEETHESLVFQEFKAEELMLWK